MIKIMISVLIALLLDVSFISGMDSRGKLSPGMMDAYTKVTEDDSLLPIFVIMNEQYDLEQLYSEVKGLSRKERRDATISRLSSFSNEKQQDIKMLLERLEAEKVVTRTRYLWITNVIGMQATKRAIAILAEHPDIKSIHYDPKVKVLDDDIHTFNNNADQDRHRRKDDRDRNTNQNYRNLAYNVELINAPLAWESGYTGEGVVVAVIDTGVNYNHNDIRNRMWIHQDFPHHGYNFVDDDLDPMDGHSHGTHCAGTVAGDGTSGLITGIAPGSRIMALKVLSVDGEGELQTLWAAKQFAVEYGADVMSVSLGWVKVEDEIRAVSRDVAVASLAAGVIISKSAGNRARELDNLPVPYNTTVPADCPPPWLSPDQVLRGGVSAVFTVGATDADDEIAVFSSRGPATWQGVEDYDDYPYNPAEGLMGLTKPDVTAPGVGVYSLDNVDISGYTSKNGTSMAAPAVAGIMALMLSKNTHISPEHIAKIIEESSVPLTETKSNIFGSGRVDAFKAVEAAHYLSLVDVSYSGAAHNSPSFNETVRISPAVYNHYIADQELFGRLTTEDDYVEIINGLAEFGVPATDTVSVLAEAFTVNIAGDIPDRYKVSFNMHLFTSEDVGWDIPFEMQVNAPHIISLTPQIYDPEPAGNNNGFIDPGEEVKVFLPVKNIGGADAPPVKLTIVCDSDLAEINTISDTTFIGLRSGEIVYPAIQMAVSEQALYESTIEFSYLYESGNYSFEGRFITIVGSILPIELGSGELTTGASDPSPINIYHKTLRSQSVYTAAELNEQGIFGPLPLSRLGYYVVNSPMYPLIDFIVRLKHTSATDVSVHDDGPFTTVYENNGYMPQQGGWDVLMLSTPFWWNGVDNILVDTAFAPVQNWNMSGQVRINEIENGFRYARADQVNMTEYPTTDISVDRPQLFMTFDLNAGYDVNRPQNLQATLSGLRIRLNWELPLRSGFNSSRRRRVSREGLNNNQNRNPDGYNIYRNGIKLNAEPVAETEYYDDDYKPVNRYFYYITAIYDGSESAPSNIASVSFKVAKPEFSLEPGEYEGEMVIALATETTGAKIFYSLDGNDPDTTSFIYDEDEKILLTETTILKAYATLDNWDESDVASGEFISLSNEPYITPAVTELYNAYPNPFNPQTVIRFALTEKNPVKIEIFNIAGQRVKILADEVFDLGIHSIIWNGDNESDNRVSSGIYFYRMLTEGYKETKKVLLLK